MSGQDGKTVIKIDWQQFQKWQRWDEWPERANNPPMNVDMLFWYKSKEYNLDCINYEYAILNADWEIVASNANFLDVNCFKFNVQMPCERHQIHKDFLSGFLFRE